MTKACSVISNVERNLYKVKTMAKNHNYYVYIMSSINKTIYIGVTNNLLIRVSQHKSEKIKGFSAKYKTKKLVYYEYFTDVRDAIKREKELKKWRREKKGNLIALKNSDWKDLYSNFDKDA